LTVAGCRAGAKKVITIFGQKIKKFFLAIANVKSSFYFVAVTTTDFYETKLSGKQDFQFYFYIKRQGSNRVMQLFYPSTCFSSFPLQAISHTNIGL
jgi:hypothetical protein